jgi:hypothetical protein
LQEDRGSHPELKANFPGVEMETNLLDPITAVEPEAPVDANLAAAAAAANSGISLTQGVSHDDNVAQTVGPQNQTPVTDDEDSDSDSESDSEAGNDNPPLVETIDLANEEDEETAPADDPGEGEELEDTEPPNGRPKRKKTARKVYVPGDGTTSYINIATAEEKRAMTGEERDAEIFHLVMTQFTLKTGLKKFKERGETAVTNELTQLHMMETFIPQDATKLTRQQRI